MNVKLIVNAQVYENYGEYQTAWKPKGGQVFVIPCDADNVMYGNEEDIINTIQILLNNISTSFFTYEYVDYIIEWGDIIELNGFDETLNKK